MMMTGRYAHLHKWWDNKDKGEYIDANGKRMVWPLYESSPLQLGHLAQRAGYGTYWAGKTNPSPPGHPPTPSQNQISYQSIEQYKDAP